MVEKSKYTLLLSFVLVSSILFNLYNNIEKIGKYMDEEFHLDQTLSYYNNNFKYWNNKLTTFPGTFLLSSFFLKIFYLLQIPINDTNSIKIVRMFSIIISTFSFIILSLFKKKINPERKLLYKFQLLISFLPINFFLQFFILYRNFFNFFFNIIFLYLFIRCQKLFFAIFKWYFMCINKTKQYNMDKFSSIK